MTFPGGITSGAPTARTVSSFFSAAALTSTAYIYGVHSTPTGSNAASPAVIVSFSMGLPTIGPISAVWTSASMPNTGTASAAFPAISAPAGMVWLSNSSQGNGAAPSAYSMGPSTASAIQYLRNYTGTAQTQDPSKKFSYGVPNTFVYLSAPIYHTTITGLQPATQYFYIVGSSTTTSVEFSFTTPPLPNASNTYPYVVGLIADVGQTVNTSTNLLGLAQQNVDLLLVAGDLGAHLPRTAVQGLQF